MICISSCLDEIADIWIRRIIKAIRLQLNCFSRSWEGRRRRGGIYFMCQDRWALRVKIQQVCAWVRAHPPLSDCVRFSSQLIQTCDLNIRCNCPKTAHQWICLLPLGSNNMV